MPGLFVSLPLSSSFFLFSSLALMPPFVSLGASCVLIVSDFPRAAKSDLSFETNNNTMRWVDVSRSVCIFILSKCCIKIFMNRLAYLSRRYMHRVQNSKATKWHTLRVSLPMTLSVQVLSGGTCLLVIFAEIARACASVLLYLLSPFLLT